MNNLSTKVNQEEVLDMQEAAQKLNIDVSSFRKLLKRRPDIKEECVFKQKYKGRKKYVITTKGLTVLAAVKESKKGNRFEKSVVATPFQKQQEKFAKASVDFMNDPIIKLRMDQLKSEQRLKTVENKLEKVEQLALEAPPQDMTLSQRTFLNERVRSYSAQTELPYSYVWRMLHGIMNKRSVEDYEFEDYKKAIKYMKKAFEKAKLPW